MGGNTGLGILSVFVLILTIASVTMWVVNGTSRAESLDSLIEQIGSSYHDIHSDRDVLIRDLEKAAAEHQEMIRSQSDDIEAHKREVLRIEKALLTCSTELDKCIQSRHALEAENREIQACMQKVWDLSSTVNPRM